MRLIFSITLLCGLLICSAFSKPFASKAVASEDSELAASAEAGAQKDLIPVALTNAEHVQADDAEEDASVDTQDASGSGAEANSEEAPDGSGAADAVEETIPLPKKGNRDSASDSSTLSDSEGLENVDAATTKEETADLEASGSGEDPDVNAVGVARTLNEVSKVEKQLKSFSRAGESEVDSETKEQFDDAMDEKDPVKVAEERREKSDTDERETGAKFVPRMRTHNAARKRTQFNWNGDDYHPGALWMYPYPYYHPAYSCGQPAECGCGGWDGSEPATEAKPDAPDDAPPPSTEKKPKAKRSHTAKHCNCRQLIPAHYYGPPSAGWGGFHPGHTGGGWGAPYWYRRSTVPIDFFVKKHKKRSKGKKRCECKCLCKNMFCRQLIPAHYYGPPSAGWGGFHPGHTGGGWGAPYWYRHQIPVPEESTYTPVKESAEMKQMIPSHYYGPPSAGWGGFHPGHTGGGWGAPYWYR